MMDTLQIIILAILQGATEFIPVSSSGHLVLARELFGWSDDGGLVLDTILHAASLAAILIYYKKDFFKILLSYKRINDKTLAYDRKMPFLIVAATLPVIVAAPFLKNILETTFRSAVYVGSAMLLTAAWFLFCEIVKKTKHAEFGFTGAVFTGITQIMALLPGASRSGWTAGAGLVSGHSRNASVKFAFYMAVPAIAGAVVFQIRDIVNAGNLGFSWLNVALGFATCFFVSLGSIHFCVKFFENHSFKLFAVYLAVAGALTILIALRS